MVQKNNQQQEKQHQNSPGTSDNETVQIIGQIKQENEEELLQKAAIKLQRIFVRNSLTVDDKRLLLSKLYKLRNQKDKAVSNKAIELLQRVLLPKETVPLINRNNAKLTKGETMQSIDEKKLQKLAKQRKNLKVEDTKTVVTNVSNQMEINIPSKARLKIPRIEVTLPDKMTLVDCKTNNSATNTNRIAIPCKTKITQNKTIPHSLSGLKSYHQSKDAKYTNNTNIEERPSVRSFKQNTQLIKDLQNIEAITKKVNIDPIAAKGKNKELLIKAIERFLRRQNIPEHTVSRMRKDFIVELEDSDNDEKDGGDTVDDDDNYEYENHPSIINNSKNTYFDIIKSLVRRFSSLISSNNNADIRRPSIVYDSDGYEDITPSGRLLGAAGDVVSPIRRMLTGNHNNYVVRSPIDIGNAGDYRERYNERGWSRYLQNRDSSNKYLVRLPINNRNKVYYRQPYYRQSLSRNLVNTGGEYQENDDDEEGNQEEMPMMYKQFDDGFDENDINESDDLPGDDQQIVILEDEKRGHISKT